MIRALVAVAVGAAAFAAAFPKVDLHLLAWVGIVPLLVAIRDAGPRRAWWLGVVFGLVWRAGTLYWVVYAMTRFGGLSPAVAVLAAAGLVGYMAIYCGLFALLARLPSPGRATTPLAIAAVWTGLELVQAHLFSGFPWALAGYAGGATAVLAQSADLAGVYGLSFAVVAVNAALAGLLAGRRREVRAALPVAALIVAMLAYGVLRLADASPVAPGSGVEVALVQGNVAQDQKWEPQLRDEILDAHLRLTARAAADGAELVIWPESSWPDAYGVERDPAARERLQALARDNRAAILVGTVRVHDGDPDLEVANAAVLFDADGSSEAHYEKVHLVPFGEYLPLRGLFGFLGPLVQAVGQLRAGSPDQPLLAAPRAGIPPFAAAICYEIVFPSLVRDQVRRGATFLVTITNDAWYGTTSAPYQHFAMARLRAIENRRWLVRAANTGISGIVDPWGRVRQRTALFTEALVLDRIEAREGLTPYARLGDLFAFLCLALAAALAAVAWRRR